MSLDVSQPIVPAMRASRSYPQLPQRQVEIVTHHQQIVERRLIKIDHFSDASAAQVHEGLGLDQQDPAGILLKLGHLSLETILKPASAGACRQVVDHLETNVVPGS